MYERRIFPIFTHQSSPPPLTYLSPANPSGYRGLYQLSQTISSAHSHPCRILLLLQQQEVTQPTRLLSSANTSRLHDTQCFCCDCIITSSSTTSPLYQLRFHLSSLKFGKFEPRRLLVDRVKPLRSTLHSLLITKAKSSQPR